MSSGGDIYASAEDRELMTSAYSQGMIITETVNCKYGCQLFGSPSWMQEHYKDCISRKRYEWELEEQRKLQAIKENAKMGLRPIIRDYGNYSADPITGIPRQDAEIKAQAAYVLGTPEYRAKIDADDEKELLAELRARGGGVLVRPDGTILDKDGIKVGMEERRTSSSSITNSTQQEIEPESDESNDDDDDKKGGES